MLLKQLYLSLDTLDFADDKAFGFRTRSMCNFVERQIAPLRFRTSFKRLCVILVDSQPT